MGLSRYNKLTFYVADLEEKFKLQYDDRIFQYGDFCKWSAYRKLDDAHKALSELYQSRENENEFDINIVERLSEFYRPDTICGLLTDSQKEILVNAVELTLDFSKSVSDELYKVYCEVTDEQFQSSEPTMEM